MSDTWAESAFYRVCLAAQKEVKLSPDYRGPEYEVSDTIALLVASAHALAVGSGSTYKEAFKLHDVLNKLSVISDGGRS